LIWIFNQNGRILVAAEGGGKSVFEFVTLFTKKYAKRILFITIVLNKNDKKLKVCRKEFFYSHAATVIQKITAHA
jgi:hypothetical protein